jgi:hypothetical protein
MKKLQEEIKRTKKLMGLLEGLNLPKQQKNLIDRVIKQIEDDFNNGDLSALEEMLMLTPKDVLIGYLPEEEWDTYKNWKFKI